MKMESKYSIGQMVYCVNFVGDDEWVEIWKDQIESISFGVDGISYMVMNNDSPVHENYVLTEDEMYKMSTILKDMKEPEKTLEVQNEDE